MYLSKSVQEASCTLCYIHEFIDLSIIDLSKSVEEYSSTLFFMYELIDLSLMDLSKLVKQIWSTLCFMYKLIDLLNSGEADAPPECFIHEFIDLSLNLNQ
jgi:hypothetical protein